MVPETQQVIHFCVNRTLLGYKENVYSPNKRKVKFIILITNVTFLLSSLVGGTMGLTKITCTHNIEKLIFRCMSILLPNFYYIEHTGKTF